MYKELLKFNRRKQSNAKMGKKPMDSLLEKIHISEKHRINSTVNTEELQIKQQQCSTTFCIKPKSKSL